MKNLSVALLAAAALSTSAVACGSSGFYLGASAGVAQTNAKYNYANQGVTLAGVPLATSVAELQRSFRADSGKAGGLFGLFVGYGAVVGNGAYVGAELYAGLDTTSFSPYDHSASGALSGGYWKTAVKHQYYYGLAARLGYMITPNTLAYIRLAAEAGKWKASVTPNSNALDAVGAAATDPGRNTVTKNKTGIQFSPGAGVEVYVNKNVFVRVEYSYLFGPKLSLTHDITALDNELQIAGTSVNHNLKLSQHKMQIGIGYKF